MSHCGGIRDSTRLPLLWVGPGEPHDADAVTLRPEDEHLQAHGCETVVDVRDEEELELALERLDPEIFLLSASGADDARPERTNRPHRAY